jgi:hypothetical protein
MVEEHLIQYGVLGLWTASLIYERFYYNREIKKIIDNNTIAITKNYEVITKCQKK